MMQYLFIAFMAGLIMGFFPSAEAQIRVNAVYEPAAENNAPPLNTRRRGPLEVPRVKAGLQSSIFSKGYGVIEALALGDKGELYILDGQNGRVSVITDRNRDGLPDITRKLPVQFDRPQSLLVIDDTLYVSDAMAVWAFKGGEKTLLASLSNVNIDRGYLPMIASPDNQSLILAISNEAGYSRVIAINRFSGKATELASGEGPVKVMAQFQGSPLWLGIGNRIVPVMDGSFAENLSHTFSQADGIGALYLPDRDSLGQNGLAYLAGQFLVALEQNQYRRDGATSRNIVAVSSAFGQPDGQARPVIDGFITNHGRTGWGEPGDMVWDDRGLFLADRQNGLIWRIHRLEPKITFSDKPAPVRFYGDDEIKKPKAEWGSSIEQGSSIVTGSELANDWEENKLVPKETLMEQLRREEKEASEADD